MKLIKASVYGFCEGVKYALNYVNKIREETKDEIYLLGNLVHNQNLMDSLKNKNINILTSGTLEERILSLKSGTVIFSAHGHDPKLDIIAKNQGLIIKDATCPRVIKNMRDIKDVINKNSTVFYIGIKNHEESNAALSLDSQIIFIDYNNPLIEKNIKNEVHVFNQTTLSHTSLISIHDKIKKIYPFAILHNDICNATFLRQQAMNEIADDIYYIIVLGDLMSSNTRRLKEIAEEKYPNKKVLLFSTLDEVKKYKFDTEKKIFLTAGASTPEEIISPIEKYLTNL